MSGGGRLSDQQRQTVEVLLATYNGERFLREQIDSILSQDYADLRVLARDDGSSDGTVSILNEYSERFPSRFRIMPQGPKSGSAKSNFLLLMQESPAPYICFSDQDDVWLPDKVSKTKQAMEKLESLWGREVPLLVFTDLRVVDDHLRTLHESFWVHEGIEPDRIKQLPLLLSRNVVTGCTAMLNRSLSEIALRMPSEASMHDCWIGLLASAMGKAKAVNVQTVLYRQHDRNVVGVEKRTGTFSESVQRLRRRNARQVQREVSQREAEALLKTHSAELSPGHRDMLRAYLRYGVGSNKLLRAAVFIRYGLCKLRSMKDIAMMLDI
ncbi:MAG: glycosyltransferase family 2 protein [Edaphobacter sp.]